MHELIHLLLRFREATLDCAREEAPGVRRSELRWCVRADREAAGGVIRLVLYYAGEAVFDRPYPLAQVVESLDDPDLAAGLRGAMQTIAGPRAAPDADRNDIDAPAQAAGFPAAVSARPTPGQTHPRAGKHYPPAHTPPRAIG